jgi:hypothetical protein
MLTPGGEAVNELALPGVLLRETGGYHRPVNDMNFRIALAAIAALFLVACSGGGGGNDARTEESLSENATAFARAFLRGHGGEAYSFLHPDYKAECPRQDFVAMMLFARAFFEGFVGEDAKLEDAELRVIEAKVEGDKGTVKSELLLDGEPIEGSEDSEDEEWVYYEGQWLTVAGEGDSCSGLDSGDGDSDEPTVAPGEIAIDKQGFTHDGEFGNVSYGIVVSNTESDLAVEFVEIQIAFYDDDGTVLDTATESISVLLPGETVGTGGFASVSSTPAEMRVQINADEWSEWDGNKPEISFSNVRLIEDEFGGFKVTGEAENPGPERLEDILISAVYLDADGNVLGGDSTYHDFIPAEGSSAFEILAFNDMPGVESVEVYGRPSFFTLDDLE